MCCVSPWPSHTHARTSSDSLTGWCAKHEQIKKKNRPFLLLLLLLLHLLVFEIALSTPRKRSFFFITIIIFFPILKFVERERGGKKAIHCWILIVWFWEFTIPRGGGGSTARAAARLYGQRRGLCDCCCCRFLLLLLFPVFKNPFSYSYTWWAIIMFFFYYPHTMIPFCCRWCAVGRIIIYIDDAQRESVVDCTRASSYGRQIAKSNRRFPVCPGFVRLLC